jgi:hypothetical protein
MLVVLIQLVWLKFYVTGQKGKMWKWKGGWKWKAVEVEGGVEVESCGSGREAGSKNSIVGPWRVVC